MSAELWAWVLARAEARKVTVNAWMTRCVMDAREQQDILHEDGQGGWVTADGTGGFKPLGALVKREVIATVSHGKDPGGTWTRFPDVQLGPSTSTPGSRLKGKKC